MVRGRGNRSALCSYNGPTSPRGLPTCVHDTCYPFASGPHCCSLPAARSEEHTSELQSLMRISYAVFCLKKKQKSTLYSTHILPYYYALPHKQPAYIKSTILHSPYISLINTT